MRVLFSKISIVLLLALSFYACDSNKKQNKGDFEIIRYDKMLFDMDLNNLKAEFDSLKKHYPVFTDLYFEKVLNMPGYNLNDSLFLSELKYFVSDTAMKRVYKLCNDVFGDMENLNADFHTAISNYYKSFPNSKKVRVYSYISGFSLQRFIFEDGNFDGIAFAPDLFLGNNFNYQRLERGQNTFSSYLIRTYNEEHIVKKTMELLLDDIIGQPSGMRAIDFMMKKGKTLYALKQIMPEIADTVLFEYSPKQLDWMHNNEKDMWAYYIKKNLFYTSDNYKIKRLTSPSPTSQALGMPTKSPGRTGNYLGYRILETYIKKNPEIDLKAILGENDSQKILEKSKFKPGKF